MGTSLLTSYYLLLTNSKMGEIKTAAPVKLIAGEIFDSEETLKSAEKELSRMYGLIDLNSEVIPFDFTDYYNNEMGGRLSRKWVSFEKLISPEQLPDIKCRTNEFENKLSKAGKRRVNIDPGYISAPSLILASTKNYSHRIYLQKGIYAEVTLVYQNGAFNFLPWTYPDYKYAAAVDFFKKAREKYLKQVR